MKTVMTIILIMGCYLSQAQDKIVKYYDSLWHSTTQDKARFVTEFVKNDTLYNCTSYYLPSRKLYGKSTFADTLFNKDVGLKHTYHENGRTKDSVLYPFNKGDNMIYSYTFYPDGKPEQAAVLSTGGILTSATHYYANGQLQYKAYYDPAKKDIVATAYTEQGKIDPNFIFQKEAEFQGGKQGWVEYIQHNLKADTPANKKAPAGKYSVLVSFLIDKTGKVVEATAVNDPGYGTREEALRVILGSPTWEPAVQINQKVSYRARQQITFMVTKD